MKLDLEGAKRALRTKIAEPSIDLPEAANGIILIAATTMSHVVTRVTTERGLDAGDFAMVAYGGAGPLHAGLVARELRIPTVVIPLAPGHFSASGMLVADLRRDFVRTWFKPLEKASFDEMEQMYKVMETEGQHALEHNVADRGKIGITRAADLRYAGQEHSVTVELPPELFAQGDRAGIKKRFDAVHLLRYGFNAPNTPAEIVSLHSSVVGYLEKPTPKRLSRWQPSAQRHSTARSTSPH